MAVGFAAARPLGGSSFRPVHQGLAERLACLHDEVKQDLDGLNRIAVAIYDPRTDLLKSFVESSEGGNPFDHVVEHLAQLGPLSLLAKTGARRVVADLSTHVSGKPDHVRHLVEAGYLSSYTVPILQKGIFHGFLFFNSFQAGYFTAAVTNRLRPIAELVSLQTIMELDGVRMIHAAVSTLRQVSHARDEETGAHLERMAHYSRLIAEKLAISHGLSDEWVEFLFQFAPLHDLGKISVPDHILRKPAKLDAAEFEIMKTHVTKGIEIVDEMADTFRLKGANFVKILRNVVAHHHEGMDGSGYPAGLKDGQISLEGRIAAVADVFDALTSARPYKQAWTVEAAMNFLKEQSGRKFDPACVDALCTSSESIEVIRRQFSDSDTD